MSGFDFTSPVIKRICILSALIVVSTLSACTLFKKAETSAAIEKTKTTANVQKEAPIEKIPFEVGVSSHNVERLAKAHNCTSNQGAGLIFKKGPVEMYRVSCEDGREFKARCELRLCEIFKS